MAALTALGVKRRCLSCQAAFFDMGRTAINCPKCGVEFKVVELPRRYPASAAGGAAPPFNRSPFGK